MTSSNSAISKMLSKANPKNPKTPKLNIKNLDSLLDYTEAIDFNPKTLDSKPQGAQGAHLLHQPRHRILQNRVAIALIPGSVSRRSQKKVGLSARTGSLTQKRESVQPHGQVPRAHG